MVAGNGDLEVDASALKPIGDEDCKPRSGCVNCVRASALGVELSDQELRTLCDAVDVRKLPKGEILISEGERDDRLYAIVSGKMEIYRVDDAGREISLQHVGPGEITGELGFVEGLKRTASVRAAEESCVVSLSRDRLESLLPDHPWLVYKLMRSVVRSAHGTVHNLDTAYADFVRYVSS